MEENRLQKIPEYSVDKIITKSDLATRGMRELGLLKNKKHYTIIYVCQFCGKLVNFASTPCIFCGKFPTTKREVVIAQALSSESMSIGDQLYTSTLVKGGKDLEIEIGKLRELIDRITKEEEPDKTYKMLFAMAEDLKFNLSAMAEKTQRIMAMTSPQCLVCEKHIAFIRDKCDKCGTELSDIQKIVLVIRQILDFVEFFLDDDSEDEESLEELIFVLVHTITRAVEKDEYPDQEKLKYIYELLHKTHYLLARRQGVGVEIKNGEARRIGGTDGDAKTREDFVSVLLAANADHLLQQYKPESKVVSLTGDEFLQINSIVEPIWKKGRSEVPPKFAIFWGGIGSGKTTIRRKELAEGYVHFDFGEIYNTLKKSLGADHPKLTTYANFACDMILRDAISEKKNIVIEIIGDNYELIEPVITKMKGIGYDLSIKVIEADPGQSYERHLKAVQEDPDYLSAYHTQEATLTYFYHYFNLGSVPVTQE